MSSSPSKAQHGGPSRQAYMIHIYTTTAILNFSFPCISRFVFKSIASITLSYLYLNICPDGSCSIVRFSFVFVGLPKLSLSLSRAPRHIRMLRAPVKQQRGNRRPLILLLDSSTTLLTRNIFSFFFFCISKQIQREKEKKKKKNNTL